MKTLYLCRHAKSSWNFDDLSDRERPLNDRGRADAPLMGQALAKRHLPPDLIVSSPAVRALSTAMLLGRELNYAHDRIRIETGLYEATTDEFLAILYALPAEAGTALVVAHNPTITEVVNTLSPTAVPEMPTAGVVCLRFQAESWADISKVNAEFYFFDQPKDS